MKKTVLISYKTSFDAAHFIPNHPGKCSQLHGHTWHVEVTMKSYVDTETGQYGLDFSELKKEIQTILVELDHRHLNDLLPYPSAENIALWLWSCLDEGSLLAPLHRIRLWESPDQYITFEGGYE